MSEQDTHDELALRIRARYGLIMIATREIERAEAAVARVASDLQLAHYAWSRSRGLRRVGGGADQPIEDTEAPAAALARAVEEGAGVFHFRDLDVHLDDPAVASHVLDLVGQFNHRRGALVLTGHEARLPDTLRMHATVLELPSPQYEDYRRLLERVIGQHSARMPVKVEITPEDRRRLLNNLAGLSLLEAEKVLTRIIVEDAALTAHDVERVMEAKRQLVEQDGLLEYYPHSEGLGQVAGLAGLKAWLDRRRPVVADPQGAEAFGLSFPKGVLLLGVPGCGKSLCAKAVAREWGLPLLKLDPGNLFDKYIGDSEKNFKRAMQIAERMAPVVLWIDELEKAFAPVSGDSDGGVAGRIFGSFLSWLQDRRGNVFVVATSNDVSKLPPEFIRKGRFDEIFFVDLPGAAARAEIFRIHLAKRRQAPERFDLAAVAAATEGFSGAEIEESIVSALYGAFAERQLLTTESLVAEAGRTQPLSRIMGERLTALRQWAAQRTVAAD